MIPLGIATALHRVMTMSDPVFKEYGYLGVRLISLDGDPTVFVEALNTHSVIQVSFISEMNMEGGDFDILIPEEDLRNFVRRKGATEMDFLNFDEVRRGWPTDVEGALDRACTVRDPAGVSFWEKSGLQLKFLRPAVTALQDIYGSNAHIRIAQKDYRGAISFQVQQPVETLIVIAPILLWDGGE
jgi:hypothetical protein